MKSGGAGGEDSNGSEMAAAAGENENSIHGAGGIENGDENEMYVKGVWHGSWQ